MGPIEPEKNSSRLINSKSCVGSRERGRMGERGPSYVVEKSVGSQFRIEMWRPCPLVSWGRGGEGWRRRVVLVAVVVWLSHC